MPRQTTILLSAEADTIVNDYMENNNCSRNKAINNLIISNKNSDLLNYVKAIYKKVKSLDSNN